jgi:hypothetical protein
MMSAAVGHLPAISTGKSTPSSNAHSENASDGYSKYNRPSSSAAASSSSHPLKTATSRNIVEQQQPRSEKDSISSNQGHQNRIQHSGSKNCTEDEEMDNRAKPKAQIMREWRQSQGELTANIRRCIRLILKLVYRKNTTRHRFAPPRYALPVTRD